MCACRQWSKAKTGVSCFKLAAGPLAGDRYKLHNAEVTWVHEGVFRPACVLHLIGIGLPSPTSADISRPPSGTFSQPGVKHAHGQMRRQQRSSGAEISGCVRPAYICAPVQGSPVASLSQRHFFFLFCMLLFFFSFIFFFIYFLLFSPASLM